MNVTARTLPAGVAQTHENLTNRAGPAQHWLAALAIDSPLGVLTGVASAQGLVGLWIDGQAHAPNWPDPERMAALLNSGREHPTLLAACSQLDAYFQGTRTNFDLPLAPAGTRFQQQVWQALQQLTYGQTTTYGRLAQQLNMPHASRAIGAAVARNPISVIIPCHRVLSADGRLHGYAGGLPRKATLLRLEGHGEVRA